MPFRDLFLEAAASKDQPAPVLLLVIRELASHYEPLSIGGISADAIIARPLVGLVQCHEEGVVFVNLELLQTALHVLCQRLLVAVGGVGLGEVVVHQGRTLGCCQAEQAQKVLGLVARSKHEKHFIHPKASIHRMLAPQPLTNLSHPPSALPCFRQTP